MPHLNRIVPGLTVLFAVTCGLATCTAAETVESQGTEHKLSLTPPPFNLDHARFELWMPRTTAEHGVVRAVIAMPLYQADRLIYELPAWRRFAADHHAVLLRHDLRTTVNGRTGRLPIGTDATGAILQSLARYAQQLDRPQLAHAPIVWTGLSQGGGQTTRLAATAPERTIAGIAYHGAAIPHANEQIGLHTIPILFPLGQQDGLTARVYPDLLGAMHHRPVWAGLLQPNVPHHLLGDQQFILMWLDAMLAARLPERLPNDQPPALRKLDYASGWLATMRVNHRFQASELEWRPVAEVPDDQRQGHWFPNASLAKAWAMATLTGQVAGHEKTEEIALRAKRIERAPVIDGQFDDWPAPLTAAQWPAQILPHGLNWHGPQDSSLHLAVAYDDQFVYLAFHVTDDELRLEGKAPWLAGQDGLEVRLDARSAPLRMSNVGRGEGEEFLLIAVGPGPRPGKPHIAGADALPDGAAVASHHDDAGYQVEIRLPASYLDVAQGVAWSRFRLNVTVNDDDASGRSQTWWRPDWRSDTNWFGSGTVEKGG